MYKLMMLFFFLTAFNSQSLTNDYQLKFTNENATYTLQIREGSLVFENNQSGVIVIEKSNASANTDKEQNASGKTYKITKGSSFEEGLKIGETDDVDCDRIGAIDDVDGDRIGETDVTDGDRIGATDDVDCDRIGEGGIGEHEIVLSYALVTVVEKSGNKKTVFPISEKGLCLYVSGDKFVFFR